jgi:YD repeat-containing protein
VAEERGTRTSWPWPRTRALDSAPREFSGTLIRRDGRTTYEHDAQGRLTRTTSAGTTWHYEYDPLGLSCTPAQAR